jgi:hypothetical protein
MVASWLEGMARDAAAPVSVTQARRIRLSEPEA